MILRPARAADAGQVADIDHDARLFTLPNVRWEHTPAEKRHWIAETLIPSGCVHVAEKNGRVLGFLALRESWVDQLYVRPGRWRQGIGGALLQLAKDRYPDGLALYCFQCNLTARNFYEGHGFNGVVLGDDAVPEPDMVFAWAGGGGR